RQLFDQAEKPVPFELLGRGLERGAKADWDNIHQWGTAGSALSRLPPVPGTPHSLHTHWRWGTIFGLPSQLGPRGSAAFAGLGRGLGRGPLLHPPIPAQTLPLAITRSVSVPSADANASEFPFERLFRPKTKPREISQGADLVLWLSFEAFRSREEATRPWYGTFFVHGMFFAHNN